MVGGKPQTKDYSMEHLTKSCDRFKDKEDKCRPHHFVGRYEDGGYLFDVCLNCGLKIPKEYGPGKDTRNCDALHRPHVFGPRYDDDNLYLFEICTSCGLKIMREFGIRRKPKILIGVDNSGWCWRRAMEAVAHCLPQFEFDILNASDLKRKKDFSEYTCAFFRGYANAFITDSNRDIIPPYVSTLSTGGNNLAMRMDEMEETAQRGHGIMVQNKRAYHECKAAGYNPVWIIPNGVNTQVYYPSKNAPKEQLVGCAANTRDKRANLKGTPFVIDACKKLKVKYIEVNHVKPLTYEEIADWYRTLTIYAQPSDSEGCSNSVCEAMSSALPCLIVKDVGYHGEVCRCATEYEDGEVIFVKRTTGDLEEKIKLLLDNKELYNRVSRNARAFALNHSWKSLSQKYRVMFECLCEKAMWDKDIVKRHEEQEKQPQLVEDAETKDKRKNRLMILSAMDGYRKKLKIPNSQHGLLQIVDLFSPIVEEYKKKEREVDAEDKK